MDHKTPTHPGMQRDAAIGVLKVAQLAALIVGIAFSSVTFAAAGHEDCLSFYEKRAKETRSLFHPRPYAGRIALLREIDEAAYPDRFPALPVGIKSRAQSFLATMKAQRLEFEKQGLDLDAIEEELPTYLAMARRSGFFCQGARTYTKEELAKRFAGFLRAEAQPFIANALTATSQHLEALEEATDTPFLARGRAHALSFKNALALYRREEEALAAHKEAAGKLHLAALRAGQIARALQTIATTQKLKDDRQTLARCAQLVAIAKVPKQRAAAHGLLRAEILEKFIAEQEHDPSLLSDQQLRELEGALQLTSDERVEFYRRILAICSDTAVIKRLVFSPRLDSKLKMEFRAAGAEALRTSGPTSADIRAFVDDLDQTGRQHIYGRWLSKERRPDELALIFDVLAVDGKLGEEQKSDLIRLGCMNLSAEDVGFEALESVLATVALFSASTNDLRIAGPVWAHLVANAKSLTLKLNLTGWLNELIGVGALQTEKAALKLSYMENVLNDEGITPVQIRQYGVGMRRLPARNLWRTISTLLKKPHLRKASPMAALFSLADAHHSSGLRAALVKEHMQQFLAAHPNPREVDDFIGNENSYPSADEFLHDALRPFTAFVAKCGRNAPYLYIAHHYAFLEQELAKTEWHDLITRFLNASPQLGTLVELSDTHYVRESASLKQVVALELGRRKARLKQESLAYFTQRLKEAREAEERALQINDDRPLGSEVAAGSGDEEEQKSIAPDERGWVVAVTTGAASRADSHDDAEAVESSCCTVCADDISDGEKLGLSCENRGCRRRYCVDCSYEELANQKDEVNKTMHCRSCNTAFPLDIKLFAYLGLSSNTILEVQLTRASAAMRRVFKEVKACKCPDCPGLIPAQDADEYGMASCGVCASERCCLCEGSAHHGMSCKEFLSGEVGMSKLVSDGIIQFCPSCQAPSVRISACPHVTCKACGTPWNYQGEFREKDAGWR